MDEELEEIINTDEEGTPEDPGDSGESSPVDEETVEPEDWSETGVEGNARVPQHFTAQPTPPYYIGDDWDNNGETYICIGDSASDTFDSDDWTPVVEPIVVPQTTTVTRYVTEAISDYSAEKLAEYEQSGATAWAIYDDGSRVQVQWSQVTEPQPPTVAADEALETALANGQHFWHNSDGATTHGGAGVHVTDQTQEDWDAAVADGFSDLSDNKPYHNILINSLGMLLRTALNHLVSITRSAITFFDGLGNNASNVVASFGKDGAQIGMNDQSHVEMDYHSLQMIDKDNKTYFHVSDMRDKNGKVWVTEKIRYIAGTNTYTLKYSPSSDFTLNWCDNYYGTSQRNPGSYTRNDKTVTLEQALPETAICLVAKYRADISVNAFTLGERASSSSVGPFSTALGKYNEAAGTSSFAHGTGCHAIGNDSHAEGNNTIAVGSSSHTEGYNTQAIAMGSHAEGQTTTASGWYSHSEGNGSAASGQAAHSEGHSTASGDWSHAEGHSTESRGAYSHAEGFMSTGSGGESHAEGYNTLASADCSHAEGYGSKASGLYSHAQNYSTIASGSSQTALGKWNESDTSKAVIIGNGTSSSARSNALTVDWSGNVETAGDITSNGYISTTENVLLKDTIIDRDGEVPTANQIGGVVQFCDKDGERLGQIEIDRLKSGMTQLRIGAFSESGGTEDQTWLDLQSDPDGDLDCITTGKTVIFFKTTDASGTADNRPALIVGGTASQAHIEIDANEIMAKADRDSTATLWLNTDGGTVGFGGNAQVSGHQFIAKSENIESNTAVSATTNGNGSYRFFGSDNAPLGMINPRFLNTGEQGVQMYTTRKVGTADKYNTLALYLDASGKPSVIVTDKEAWREGIGLGDTEKVTAIASVITAEEGVTISTAQYAQWGKMVQLRLQFKFDTANTTAASRNVGTMVSGKRPVYVALGNTSSPNTTLRYATVGTGGVVAAYGTFAANSTYTLGFTYLLP